MTHAREGRPASAPPFVAGLHRVARWVFAAQPAGEADEDDDPLLGAFNLADDFEATPVIWERPIER